MIAGALPRHSFLLLSGNEIKSLINNGLFLMIHEL